MCQTNRGWNGKLRHFRTLHITEVCLRFLRDAPRLPWHTLIHGGPDTSRAGDNFEVVNLPCEWVRLSCSFAAPVGRGATVYQRLGSNRLPVVRFT